MHGDKRKPLSKSTKPSGPARWSCLPWLGSRIKPFEGAAVPGRGLGPPLGGSVLPGSIREFGTIFEFPGGGCAVQLLHFRDGEWEEPNDDEDDE